VPLLEQHLELDPQVALRPEPFGALAYHYGNRKLIFLRHPDMLRVVRSLDGRTTLSDALRACEIAERRWPSFEAAVRSLTDSEMLHEREPVTTG
jgi:putative mycofactocin binding protein MftB